ncbi:hypothetical protein QQ045_028382 [Rhodiola kirilowii]
MGDFNVVTDMKEKHEGNKPDAKAMFEFNEFLTRVGLSDMGFNGSPYTCHSPLLLKLREADVKSMGFIFLGAWINHKGFKKVVALADAWVGKLHKSPIVNLALKIKKVCAALKYWNWNKFGDVRVRLNGSTKRLDEQETMIQHHWCDDTNKEIIDIKGEITELLRYNFSILEEKARVGWLPDGDRNSGFFHAVIKARRSQNRIRLHLKDGSLTDDVDTIGAKAEEYFKGITQEQNDNLCKVPSKEEIRETIKSMNLASATGLDGVTGKFYSSCWEIIKEDIRKAIEGFFHGLQLPRAISSTSVILLPKINRANFMDQHPKLLFESNPMLVGMEQSGFIEGRSIIECIGLAHDIVRDINHKTFGGNVMVKLDMSKAYDRLTWRFLEVMTTSYLKRKFSDIFPPAANFCIDDFELSNRPDQLRWKGSDNDIFSAGNFYRFSRVPQPKCIFFAVTWQA